MNTLALHDKIVDHFKNSLLKAESSVLNLLPGAVRELEKTGAWRERIMLRHDRRRVVFASFEEFLRADAPEGMRVEPDTVRRFLASVDSEEHRRALDAFDKMAGHRHGGDRRSEGFKRPIEALEKRPKGRQQDLRRLRKDRPDLHERVLAGDLSAHAAMIEAGFRAKPTPLARLETAWRQASDAERRDFLVKRLGELEAMP